MGIVIRGNCQACGTDGVNLHQPCRRCHAPAMYELGSVEQRAWHFWCGTWWKPWTWLRFGWIEHEPAPPPPDPRIVEIHQLLEEVKVRWQDAAPGRCKILSQGEDCRCTLCLADRIHAIAEGLR